MKIFKYFAGIVSALVLFSSLPVTAQDNASANELEDEDIELLVPIPEPPKSIERLDERSNYVLEHFWDNFGFKNAFSARKRFDKTLGTFFSVTPYATADTVHMVIDRLIKGIEKARPQNLLDLAEAAERWVHGDNAEYSSDELYYPFLEAVVRNKKAKGPLRARFEAQYRQLQNSRVGANVGDFSFKRPDGATMTLAEVSTPHILLMFVDPDCPDCLLAKARLNADFVIESLVKNQIIGIVPVYPGEATDEKWLQSATTMPEGWIAGANPEADLLFEIPQTPTIYYIHNDGSGPVVKSKNASVDGILDAFHSLIQNTSAPNQSQPSNDQ